MKKAFLTFGLIVAASFLLSNCSKDVTESLVDNGTPEEIIEGIPFELTVNTPDTKTTNDGLNTSWTSGDGVSVFHATADGSDYTKEGQFTIAAADIATGTFKGTLSSAPVAGSHDWYLFYPYASGLDTPANTNDYYYTLGQTKTGTQTQEGNNSMAHLDGNNFPLYGKVTGVPYNEVPTVTMNHALAYIEFNVTNSSSKPLSVETITFKGTEAIVGHFYIDFHDPSSVVYTSRGSSYVNNTATLTVEGGASIASGSSAKFYIGVKPFTAPKDGVLEVCVNGYKKTLTISKAGGVGFAAGKIKKLNFSYDYEYQYFVHTTSIAVGDVVILTNGLSGDVSVMKHYDTNTLSGNAYDYETLSVSGSVITATPNTAILTVGDGGEGSYTFYDEANSKYVDATSTTTSNNMKGVASITDYSKFSVGFSVSGTNEGAAIIKTTGKSSRDYVQYNGRFACYNEGTQQPVYLFKKIAKMPVSIAITTAPTKLDYKVGDDLDWTGAVVTATYDDASTADVTAYVSSDAASVLAHPGSGKTVTVSYMGQTATFTVNVAKGDAGLSYATASYTVSPNASFVTPSLENPHGLTVTYSASNNRATVNASTGAVTIGNSTGDVIITAHTDGDADYAEGDASYTITIKSIVTNTYVFTSKSWAATLNDAAANWTSGKDGNALNATQGVQITSGATGANATSPRSFTNVSSIVVTYSTNNKAGVGTIKVKVGSGVEQTFSVNAPSGGGGTSDKTKTFSFSPYETGNVKLTVDCTTNSLYVKQIAITSE